MQQYDVIVIGAGNGGLTAAAGIAKKGYKTLLLERHNVPGGCGTSFIRGRFEFEVALHQLSGIGFEDFPGPLRSLLASLGAADKLQFVQQENLYRYVVPGKLDITLKADRAAAQQELIENFPAEKEGIIKLFDTIYTFCGEMVHGLYMMDPEASPKKYPTFFKLALKDAQEVLDDCIKDPVLQQVIGIYWSYAGQPPSRLSFMDFAQMLWAYLEFKPWHIKGGSQAMSNAILDSYLGFGGDVKFNCGAKKINLAGGKIKSVVTEDGDEISTKFVVSNADPITTLIDLIGAENCPAAELKKLNSRTIGVSASTLYLGFDCNPEDMGITKATNFMGRDFLSHDAIHQAMKKMDPGDFALMTCYDVDDPDFSPEGACQASLVTLQYAQPWMSIPSTQYHDAKYRYAEKVLELAETVFPGMRNHIEEAVPSTPLTHMRYLGHPGGSIYGNDHYKFETGLFTEPNSMIEGLYFAGAWNGAGGFEPTLEVGAAVAKQVTRLLKKQEQGR